MFLDASSQAMAACAYIVQKGISELLAGKCKLPRLKGKPTIPKIRKKISITSVHVLTYSEIALSWIRSTAKGESAGVFVNNRRREVHQLVKDMPVAVTFGSVKTSENPADSAKRGMRKEEFKRHLWWKGPSFITKPPTDWDKEYKLFFSI
ncbi:hypothetical protein RB195_011588 [Necator americanus]|uniref:Uncharacterized protein n=1 Tax=Necator americanus TaxID=51031 RepID=A0ABR1D4V0_NECAM